MSKYKGLFTFDEDNHRYVPIAQADGIIDTMDYEPDSEPKEPLIKDELARKAIRAWAEANSLRCDDKVEARTPTVDCCVLGLTHGFTSIDVIVNEETSLKDYSRYTIEELCGEEDE